jgi:hypothetical protein
MNDLFVDFLWWLLATPIMVLRWTIRTVRRLKFWRTAYAPEILCGNCGAAISLVGIWKCGCQFTYRGHLLRECPICGSMPRMVRCFNCGVTERLLELCD